MSLRLRLMLAVAGVVLASIAAVALISRRVVRVELDEFVRTERGPQLVDRREVATALAAHYERQGWKNIQPLLARLRDRHFPGHELLLLDRDRRLIAVSSRPSGGLTVVPRGRNAVQIDYRIEGGAARLLLAGGDVAVHIPGAGHIATLHVGPSWNSPKRDTLRAVDRALLPIVVAVGVLALISTALVARNVIRPVEQLQHAVERIEKGDVGHRVAVTSTDEVGKLARAFNSMSEQLAHDEVLRRNLVNDVAHELRTPLTNLICTVEALQDGLREPEQAVVDSLHDDLMLLQRLVDDLQTLALAEAGKLPLHLETVDVGETVERWVAAQAEPGRSRIAVDVPSGLRITVDRMRFQQIVANLVRNALAHTEGSVELAARPVDRRVELLVRDHGAGITAEHLPHIFDRFYRGDPSRDRSTGGAGLGLAIVKNLVALHGAHIEVESEVGRGTTFRITF